MIEASDLFESRRSVHEYDDREFDGVTLGTIFENVCYTPSGYSLQPWEFVVVRDEANKADLAEGT